MANPFLNQCSKYSLPLFPLVTASVAASTHTASGSDTLTVTLQDNATAASFHNGVLRVRTRSVSAACTAQLEVEITDGTTTETALIQTPATVAGDAIEIVVLICSDLNVNSVALNWTLGGTVGTGITVDAELFGN
ncbi:MAG TPA: hypothetical protein VGT24_01550 [Candidatus Acidoferrales bacterium]|nr:hypothetical protein [Candidatus Acidoferrales bacterium]